MGRKKTKRSKGRMRVRGQCIDQRRTRRGAAIWDDTTTPNKTKGNTRSEGPAAPMMVRTPVRIVHRKRTPGDVLHRAKASILAHVAMLRANSAETLEAARECARRVERWRQLRIARAT